LAMLTKKYQFFLDLNPSTLVEPIGNINMFASQVFRCIFPQNIVG
jgi:hypothetical protein